jgi:hypothetical protein
VIRTDSLLVNRITAGVAMVSLSTGFSGLTRAQQELVAHWESCRDGQRLPDRDSLDPGAIRAHLSAISIVELEAQGQVRFRLAGSGLRDILGREMRGRLVSELGQTESEMWALGLSSALDQMRPVGGLIARDSDCHAWLRLPLRSSRGSTLLLCHDALVPKTRAGRDQNDVSNRQGYTQRTLAA